MSFQAKIDELRAQKQQLLDKAQGLADEGKLEELGEITDQMEGINNSIKSLERLMSSQGEVSKLVYDGALHSGKKETKAKEEQEARPFASLGEQLKAVYNLRRNGVQDQRLIQVNNAVLGSNEGTGADGGFAIQTDFAGVILESALERNSLLQRLDRYTVSSGANSMRWVMADETDISKSVFGGVQMYWAAEGGTVPATHPKLREVKLDLEKMMGFAYCTEEMMEDAAFMSGFFSTAFSLAADELLTDAVIGGDGVGKPLGILNSSALVTVAKETSQAAGTFVGNNAVKMLARAMPKNRDRLVWLMHPDMEEQLPALSITSSDGSTSKFLWDPEGGIRNFDTQRILGKPVIFDQNCATPGVVGDVMLVDPFQYILLSKGTIKQDWSMHVEFLTDQMCFRVVFRCNGTPKVNSPLTIKNSTKTRSPFVALADRK